MRRIVAAGLMLALFGGVPAVHADEVCVERVLVLAAFPGEIDLLLHEAEITEVEVLEDRAFYVGTLRGNAVVLGLTGIGLVNARNVAETVLAGFACEHGPGITGVVFSGVSGGRTSIGDVTVPARWTFDDGHTWHAVDEELLGVARAVASDVTLASAVPAGDPACAGIDPRLVQTVDLARAPEVIVGGDGRSSDPFGGRAFPCFPRGGDVFGCEPCRAPAHQAPDPARTAVGVVPFIDPLFFFGYFQSPPGLEGYDAEDMETAAVAEVAAAAGVPFIAFRALSDGLGDPLMLPGFPFQFFFYRQLAADNAAAMALRFLEAWATR